MIQADTQQPAIHLEQFELRENLLPNSSFETAENAEAKDKQPAGWQWSAGKTDATAVIDAGVAHSGKHSLRITNGTPNGPHIFGMLQLPGGAAVKPNVTYTFSCYVKGGEIGRAWFGGGDEWLVRGLFPRATSGLWQRVVLTFTTGKKTANIPVLLITESPTDPFWVDDVQLVEGGRPMPVFDGESAGNADLRIDFPTAPPIRDRGAMVACEWNTSDFPRDKYIFAHRALRCDGFLHLPRGIQAGNLTFRLADAQGKPLCESSQKLELAAGTFGLNVECPWGESRPEEVVVHIDVAGKTADADQNAGAPVSASLEHRRRIISENTVESLLAEVEQLRERLRRHVEDLGERKLDPAYPLVTLTILDNFVDYAREDVARDELARAYDAALQMRELAQKALARTYLPPSPRYVTAENGRGFRLSGPAQLGVVRWPDGRTQTERPLQFLGLGHFGQVKNDIEKAVAYGCNIIQIELGPNSVLPAENEIDEKPIEQYLGFFDRAAKAGVAVNLLVSPHYFPQWAYEKWPHLRDAGGGFLQVDVQAPEARQVYEKFLRVLIPRIKDHTALHSICLSNEPVFTSGENSVNVRKKWHEWLRTRHGDIAALNRRWRSDYADFDSIPSASSERMEFSPLYADYLRFNREAFAEFHAWMAGLIREMAPDVPLHAKIMIAANFARHAHGPWCVSPDLFARLSDINGNDCWKYYLGSGTHTWANDWQSENMGYDFQRSMADKPVFNSENHLIPDRNLEPVPPEHIANVFWQGAVHGQNATTTWVWERTYSFTSDITGSIMHRPACVEAMGRTGLDLMRLAEEVDALQRMPVEAALLWSPTSILAGEEYPSRTKQAYEAMNFLGIRLGFVTDRQLQESLESGELPQRLAGVKLIVVAGANHVPESTLDALVQFSRKGGRVLCLDRCFAHDDYGLARQDGDKQNNFHRVNMPANTRELFDIIAKETADLPFPRPVSVKTPDGRAAWGVEYLPVRHEGRLLVNLVNYLNRTQKIQLTCDGREAAGIDLLSGQNLGPIIELAPLRPVFLEIRGDSAGEN